MKVKQVCILGGGGFVGRNLVNCLVREGYTVRVFTRRLERNRHLLVYPSVELVEVNAFDVDTLAVQMAGCDLVINLVGILNEHGGKKGAGFAKVHIDIPRNIVEACRRLGIRRFIHMSVLNADVEAPSYFLRSRGEAEDFLLNCPDIDITVIAPSIIFGPEDNFINRYLSMMRLLPVVPMPCADARFSPVYINDVVHCVMVAMRNDETIGKRYALCGPRSYDFKELLQYAGKVAGRSRPIIGLGDGMSRIMGRLLGLLPNKPMTYDNYLTLRIDSVCKESFPKVFGIVPKSLESILPRYLAEQGQRGSYYRHRRSAGRD